MTSQDDRQDKPGRIIDIKLDEVSIGRNTPEVEHERQVAIFDILEANSFELVDNAPGPYCLRLAIVEKRLAIEIAGEDKVPITTFVLSLSPLSKLIKDYFLVCESYYDAIKTAPPSRIEALDMGRRALHDEGSRILLKRLDGKIDTDFDTGRRLFTLICALHWKG
ncbi:MAG: UPF0262 family protein [Rhodomicrobium sp.]|nr:UPF0262 family protein [Rhodomicrobium sp.]